MIPRMFALLPTIVLLLTGTPSRAAAPRAQDQFDATFRLLEQADAARGEGRTDDARRLYGAAIAAYQELAAKHPDTQTELVLFRIGYCRNQIMGLLAAPATAAVTGATNAVDTPAPAPRDPPGKAAVLPVAPSVAEGIALCRTGQFERARTILSRHLTDAPDDPVGLLAMGTACLGLGDNIQAIAMLKRAVEMAPAMGEAHYNLAQLLVRATAPDIEAARHHYRESIRLGGMRDDDLEAVLAID